MLELPQNEVETLRQNLVIRDAEISLNRAVITAHLNEKQALASALQEAERLRQLVEANLETITAKLKKKESDYDVKQARCWAPTYEIPCDSHHGKNHDVK